MTTTSSGGHDFDDFVILFFYNSKLTVSGIEQVNKMYK